MKVSSFIVETLKLSRYLGWIHFCKITKQCNLSQRRFEQLLVSWKPDVRVVGGSEENGHLVESFRVSRENDPALDSVFKQHVRQPAREQQVQPQQGLKNSEFKQSSEHQLS